MIPMAKSKDAFALRDFDKERILQRKFFFYRLGIAFEDTDIVTLEIYYSVGGVSHKGAKAMEQKLSKLRKVTQAILSYKYRLDKHLNKLDGYVSRYAVEFVETNSDDFKRKYARADDLSEKYTEYRRATEQLFDKCKDMISEGEKAIQQQYKKDFAGSLKRIRQERHMSQRELAGRLGIAVPTLSQYENCIVEPTIKNLIRLANALEVSTDELLGRCC